MFPTRYQPTHNSKDTIEKKIDSAFGEIQTILERPNNILAPNLLRKSICTLIEIGQLLQHVKNHPELLQYYTSCIIKIDSLLGNICSIRENSFDDAFNRIREISFDLDEYVIVDATNKDDYNMTLGL